MAGFLILQHPSTISFENIESIYADYPETFAPAVRRYYVYVKTDDPYNLKIGTYKTRADSENLARFLNGLIRHPD